MIRDWLRTAVSQPDSRTWVCILIPSLYIQTHLSSNGKIPLPRPQTLQGQDLQILNELLLGLSRRMLAVVAEKVNLLMLQKATAFEDKQLYAQLMLTSDYYYYNQ